MSRSHDVTSLLDIHAFEFLCSFLLHCNNLLCANLVPIFRIQYLLANMGDRCVGSFLGGKKKLPSMGIPTTTVELPPQVEIRKYGQISQSEEKRFSMVTFTEPASGKKKESQVKYGWVERGLCNQDLVKMCKEREERGVNIKSVEGNDTRLKYTKYLVQVLMPDFCTDWKLRCSESGEFPIYPQFLQGS